MKSIESDEVLGKPSMAIAEPEPVGELCLSVQFTPTEDAGIRGVPMHKMHRDLIIYDLSDSDGKIRAMIGEAMTDFLRGKGLNDV